MQSYYDKDELIWVAPGAVRYDIEQVEFLLPWLENMRAGNYPPEPVGGYVGGSRSRSSHRASYEAICQVAAELDSRLARTRLDRYLVEDYYCNPSRTRNSPANSRCRPGKSAAASALPSLISPPAPAPGGSTAWTAPLTASCRRKKRVGISYADWKRMRVHQWSERKKQHLLSIPLTNRA